MNKLSVLYRMLKEQESLPRCTVNLHLDDTVDNDPFYARIADEFYSSTQKRYPLFPFIKKMECDCAIGQLPENWDLYFDAIEASARRNYKKADRSGYSFRRFNYNEHLEDIRMIRQSTNTRQGPMPEEIISGPVTAVTDPPSRSPFHDYLYCGVFQGGRLFAYAGLFVCGEVCMIQHILGHAEHQQDGIVPYLIISQASMLYKEYPQVNTYMYGSWYGASEGLQRFKRRFLFRPARVSWMK